MANLIGANIYVDGIKHNPYPISLKERNYDISDVASKGDNVDIQVTYAFDDGTESELSPSTSTDLEFITVFSHTQTSEGEEGIYWVQVYKSSEYPQVTTTKPYFCIWSTDHAEEGGGIYWGEMDDKYFTGFVERGAIITGNQAETPSMIFVPTEESGLEEDTIFLYYHGTGSSPNGIVQETKLITSTGGVLHQATWTNRGAPLGAYNDDTHTGYARFFRRGANDYIATHLSNHIIPKSYTSESTNALDYTRVSEIDNTTGMTMGGSFSSNQMALFQRNGTMYAFVHNRVVPPGETIYDNYLTLVEIDNVTFLPSRVVKRVSKVGAVRNINLFIENNIAYLYFKLGGSANNDTLHPLQVYEYDLRNLDEDVTVSDRFIDFEIETLTFLSQTKIELKEDTFFKGTPQEIKGIELGEALDGFLKTINPFLGKLKVIFPFVGGAQSKHTYNLLNPSTDSDDYWVVWVGGWQHLPTGIKPNGVDTLANTRISPSDFSNDLNNLSFYSRDNTFSGAGLDTDIGAFNEVGQALMMSAARPSGDFYVRNYGDTSNVPNSDARGFYMTTRVSTTSAKSFKNGVLQDTFDGSGQKPTENILIGTYGSSDGHTNREYAFFAYGDDALTDQEALEFYNAVQQLQIDLKREV